MATEPAGGRDPHLGWEALAVEHVLGGLDTSTSSKFRDHLIGCDDCRRHVAELRGIAADLQTAERQERAVVRTKPEAERRAPDPEDEAEVPRRPRLLVPAVLMTVVVLAVLSFWTVHLREVRLTLEAGIEAQARALEVWFDGTEVPVTSIDDGIEAKVVRSDDQLLVGVDSLFLTLSERLVLWAYDAQGEATALAMVGQGGFEEGRTVLTGTLEDHVSIELRVQVVTAPVPAEPAGAVVLTADL